MSDPAEPAVNDGTICPQCGGPIVEIVFGLPDAELFDAAERGDAVLGGCTLPAAGEPTRSCGCGFLTASGHDPEFVAIPSGLHYAPEALYRLQHAVGPDGTFGVALAGGTMFGITSDNDPDEWDVVYEMSGAPPWEVLFRCELVGDAIEWAAKRVDAAHALDRPVAGTVAQVVVNTSSIDAVVVAEVGYRLVREEFAVPGAGEDIDRGDTVREALFDAIMESYR